MNGDLSFTERQIITQHDASGDTAAGDGSEDAGKRPHGNQAQDVNVNGATKLDGDKGEISASISFVFSDLVACHMCGRPLTSPRVLPCYHTVCSSCLNQYISAQIPTNSEKTVFPCPVCSCPTKLPSTDKQLAHQSYAERFETDTFVEKLSNVLSAFKDNKVCDLCQRRGIAETAGDWCMECLDAICQGCLKVHLSGKTTGDHTVVSLSELRKLSLASVMRRGLSQACRTHAAETVRFYCLDCRAPVCVQCLTQSHRKCEQCLPVGDAMTSMNDSVADVMVRMRAATSAGSETGDVNVYQSGAQVLEDSVKEAEERIRSLAAELRQCITDREQELLERLHSVASQLQEKVGDFRGMPGSRDDDVKTLSSAHTRLDALMKYGSDVEVLELFQAVQSPLSRLEGTDISSGEDEVRLTVKFSPDDLVQAFHRDFQSLGEVNVQDSSSDEGLSAWGVAVTERDDIIVVDCRNRRVQKFGCSGDLLDHIQVSSEPRDVTFCGRSQQAGKMGGGGEGEEEVAVTMSGKQVYVITVSSKMALKRRFKTSKQYDGIAFSPASSLLSSTKTTVNCFFLVSSLEERCVDVISTEGDVVKTFGGVDPKSGNPQFSTPRYVATTKEGHFAVSDTGKNCVVCLTQDGGAQFRYAPEGSHEITSPQGVSGDKFGNLFLADYGNSRVHMVTPDGEFERFVLGPDSGLRRPVAVAMTPRSSKLVLVQSDGVVKVFSYADTKVKMKVPCWCPRCSTSTDDGEDKPKTQGRLGVRSRTSSLGGHSAGSSGSGSRGSRSGSESCGPLSPSSPVFHTPHLNGRMKKF